MPQSFVEDGLNFLLGLVIGSFLNVCIVRIPSEQSIVRPRSRCPKCGTPVKAFDNIPVLSWLLLGGRCRNCKEKISVLYPLVELFTGVLFAACYAMFGLTPVGFKWTVFSCLIVVLTITDLRERLLPAAVTFLGVGLGLALSAGTPPVDGAGQLLWGPLSHFIPRRPREGPGVGVRWGQPLPVAVRELSWRGRVARGFLWFARSGMVFLADGGPLNTRERDSRKA